MLAFVNVFVLRQFGALSALAVMRAIASHYRGAVHCGASE
jgi:hypothetical protein